APGPEHRRIRRGRQDQHPPELLRHPPGLHRLHGGPQPSQAGALPARQPYPHRSPLPHPGDPARLPLRGAVEPGLRDHGTDRLYPGMGRQVDHPHSRSTGEGMTRMDNAREVVERDLEHIHAKAGRAFEAMAGKRLLVVGGAGFLGYYLVQSVVAWNRAADPARRIELLVFDNFIRGVPAWLTAQEGTPGFTLARHDISRPLPGGMPDLHFIVHAGSIASPIYYRQHPIETMDANVNGLRSLLEYARAQSEKGKPVEGFLFYSSSEIYGDPTPENIPTPETYRGNVSCTGPRACYDESKRDR